MMLYIINLFSNMLRIIQKIKDISKNQPTHSAYPTYKRKPTNNVDTVHIDTVDKTIRLIDKKATNKSFSL